MCRRSGGRRTSLLQRVAELEGQVGALAEKVSVLARTGVRDVVGEVRHRGRCRATAPGRGGPGSERRGRGQRRARARPPGLLPSADPEEGSTTFPRPSGCARAAAPGYALFGEECCEQIDWQVALNRIVHRRPTYRRTCRCPVRGVLVAPPVPKAIGKGRFTTGFLARLLTEKFVLGGPCTGSSPLLAHDGLDVAEGTLAGVFAACSDLLAPLAARRSATATPPPAHLHIDETSWNVSTPRSRARTATAGGAGCSSAPTPPCSRSPRPGRLRVLTAHLGIDTDDDRLPDALPERRQVLLSSDFYAVYQVDGPRGRGRQPVVLVPHPALLHPRRGRPPRTGGLDRGWVERIAALYLAHTALGAAAPGSGEYTWAAAQFSAALNTIDAERSAQRPPRLLHPAAAKVLATLDREWDGLARHREYPELPAGQQHLRAGAARAGGRPQELLRLRLGCLRRAGFPRCGALARCCRRARVDRSWRRLSVSGHEEAASAPRGWRREEVGRVTSGRR